MSTKEYNAKYYQRNKKKILKQKSEYRKKQKQLYCACVYQILNKVNEKIYIGGSSRGELRWKQHLRSLRGNYHINPKLQADFDKFGEEAFEWSIIKEVDKDKETLVLEEAKTIDSFLKEGKELYNLLLTIDHCRLTKEGLAKAKERGVKLGGPRGEANGAAKKRKHSDERLFPLIAEAEQHGHWSLSQIALYLNNKGIKTQQGREFTKQNLSPLRKRYRKQNTEISKEE